MSYHPFNNVKVYSMPILPLFCIQIKNFMKKIFTLVVFALLATTMTFAQDKKPVASPKQTVTSGNVSVTYGQPSKKGRAIFGGLVPYGQVWRTGANEATEITFNKDVDFGGKHVKAGTYTLFTIPTEKEWTIILNSQLKQFGAFDYDKYKSKDVVHVTVPAKHISNTVEKFTISAESNALILEWDQTSVRVPMKF
jgi:hypothetical protein